MKKVKTALISLLIVVLGVSAWFYGYYHRKSNDNLPALERIVEMDEADVNKLLSGYRRVQLREVWNEPDESELNQDIWKVHEGASLVVNYNNKDIVVVCSIPAIVEMDHGQIRGLAEAEFAELFKDHSNVQINKTSIMARSDDMNHVVILIEYSSDEESGSYGFEYQDGENGSPKLIKHGKDVTRNNLLN